MTTQAINGYSLNGPRLLRASIAGAAVWAVSLTSRLEPNILFHDAVLLGVDSILKGAATCLIIDSAGEMYSCYCEIAKVRAMCRNLWDLINREQGNSPVQYPPFLPDSSSGR